MFKYTRKNIIMHTDDRDLVRAIGKKVYCSSDMNLLLQHANNDECEMTLVEIKDTDHEPFTVMAPDGVEFDADFIIIKKEEPKFQYVPFKSMEEFADRYSEVAKWADYASFEDNLLQCGMWLKYIDDNDKPVYTLVCEIKDEGVKLDEHGRFTWEELFSKGFLFPNDTPCGKLVEVEHE